MNQSGITAGRTALATLLLIFCMLMAMTGAQTAYAEGEAAGPQEPPEPQATVVKGLAETLTKPASSDIIDTISVSPAKERVIALQMYDKAAKAWTTKQEFRTGPELKENIDIVYPGDWKGANSTLWRLRIEEGNGGAAYTSPKIKIMARNRETLKLHGKSVIIMEKDSGQIFYGKAMDTPRAQASTTKIMTVILALENNSWDDNVTLSAKAVKTPYTSLKYAGDKIRMKDLVYAALLPSDNGAATALAEHTSGSVRAFAEDMNRKAEALGCKNTSFVNPHGLDQSGHYSTARDLALTAGYAMNNDKFRKAVKTRTYKFRSLKKKKYYSLETTNELLGKTAGLVGVKTGTTENAGCCFVGAYRYKGKDYITVVLGSGKDNQRWKDTKRLIRYIKKYV